MIPSSSSVVLLHLVLCTPCLAQEPAQEDPWKRLSTLEKNVEDQGRQIEELTRALESRGGGLTAGFDNGFFVQSPDGRERLDLGALLQINGNFFERGLENRDSEFILRRMRFEISGEFYQRFIFNVEPKFTESKVELEEAWIGARWEPGELLIGRMKEPFSLEEMNPQKHLDYVNFSILNQFVPAEDHGLTWLGSAGAGRVQYGAALYQGNGSEPLVRDDDVALRVVFKPFAPTDSSLQGLQMGAAVTAGRSDESLAGEELKTEARVPFLDFEPGSALDGDRVRRGLEAAYLVGPFAVSGEWISIEEEVVGSLGEDRSLTRGWYVATSCVLTGEKKSFRGVRPEAPVAGANGSNGWGALQLAARFSTLALDDDWLTTGLVAPEEFPRRVQSFDIGFNWYLTYYTRIKLHYLHTHYDRDILFDDQFRSEEDAVLVQFQINF